MLKGIGSMIGAGTNPINKLQKSNECSSLAQKYGVAFIDGKWEAGCPGIMDPLGETPGIEPKWLSDPTFEQPKKRDKLERGEQFYKALKAIDSYVEGDTEILSKYSALNIHGRAMFFFIASNNLNGNLHKQIDDMLKIVTPDAEHGLEPYMEKPPYEDKGAATTKQIFQKYIASSGVYSQYIASTPETQEEKKESHEHDTALIKALMDSHKYLELEVSKVVKTVLDTGRDAVIDGISIKSLLENNNDEKFVEQVAHLSGQDIVLDPPHYHVGGDIDHHTDY